MKFIEFKKIMSEPRVSRYITACNNNSKKSMTLYRLNLKLSQELFTIISCFEIALRNSIDKHYTSLHGSDWLRDSVDTNGFFDNNSCRKSKKIIQRGIWKLNHNYTHSKLIAEMDFGFWRYLFAQPQFYSGGQSLLRIFPDKPTSSKNKQYNHSYIYNELEKINDLRNRVAHHEPVCFRLGHPVIGTTYAKQNYLRIKKLFDWMRIDESSLLYGIDHINQITQKIDNL